MEPKISASGPFLLPLDDNGTLQLSGLFGSIKYSKTQPEARSVSDLKPGPETKPKPSLGTKVRFDLQNCDNLATCTIITRYPDGTTQALPPALHCLPEFAVAISKSNPGFRYQVQPDTGIIEISISNLILW